MIKKKKKGVCDTIFLFQNIFHIMVKKYHEKEKNRIIFFPNPLDNQRSLTIVREMASQMVVCISVGLAYRLMYNIGIKTLG